jgi:Lar family restriction alleviation protein
MPYSYDDNDRDDGGIARCPHCGGEALLLFGGITGMKYRAKNGEVKTVPHLYKVACVSCGAQTDAYEDKMGAILAWNRRTK